MYLFSELRFNEIAVRPTSYTSVISQACKREGDLGFCGHSHQHMPVTLLKELGLNLFQLTLDGFCSGMFLWDLNTGDVFPDTGDLESRITFLWPLTVDIKASHLDLCLNVVLCATGIQQKYPDWDFFLIYITTKCSWKFFSFCDFSSLRVF